MASFIRLTIKYNLLYAVLAFIEYNSSGLIEDLAQRAMNKIASKKYGKEVFWKS